MEEKKGNCTAPPAQPPELVYVRPIPGLDLGSHAFLRPLPPCCAQIASPYWGRVIGVVSNSRADEVLINVTATLFDENGRTLGTHSDFMVLDGGARSEFDIKITTFYDHVGSYGLEVTEAHDL
jgi:hypothetical protein